MKRYLGLVIVFLSLASIFGYSDDIEEVPKPELEPHEPPTIAVYNYYIYTTRVNWTEAMKLCRNHNMELVSITSKKENDKVIKAIRDAGQGLVGFWTSGSKIKTNGEFFWGNGKAVTFTDWENGHGPDNLHKQNGEEKECIEIKGFNILKWNDNFCDYGLYYICEEALLKAIN